MGLAKRSASTLRQVRLTDLAPGESRIIAQLTSARDSNLLIVRCEANCRYVALIDAKWSGDDPRRVQNEWKTAATLHELYVQVGLALQVPPHKSDVELAPFLAPRPGI